MFPEHQLRVPLDPKDELACRTLDRLDDAVRCVTGSLQIMADRLRGLMVVRIHLNRRLTIHTRQQRSGLYRHCMTRFVEIDT